MNLFLIFGWMSVRLNEHSAEWAVPVLSCSIGMLWTMWLRKTVFGGKVNCLKSYKKRFKCFCGQVSCRPSELTPNGAVPFLRYIHFFAADKPHARSADLSEENTREKHNRIHENCHSPRIRVEGSWMKWRWRLKILTIQRRLQKPTGIIERKILEWAGCSVVYWFCIVIQWALCRTREHRTERHRFLLVRK